MKRILPLSVLTISVLLAACSATNTQTQTQTSEPGAPTGVESAAQQGAAIEAVTGKTWVLEQIQSMDDSLFKPRAGHSYTLSFNADGQVLVQADCNRGFGAWQHTPPSGITLGPAAMTRRACGEDTEADRFLKELTYVRSFVMREGDLYLATMADGSILKFVDANQPSFDCSRAEGSVQELICSDTELSMLDRRLDELYRKGQETFPEEEIATLKATQRGWIKGRDECWKAEDMDSCARDEYTRRITELEIQTGNTEVPAPTLYSCDDGRLLTAYFYNRTLMPALMLGDGENQSLLFQEVAASGARYQGRNVEFWESGAQARYTNLSGETVQCSKR